MASAPPTLAQAFPAIEASGEPYEIGRQYGVQARDIIGRRLAMMEAQSSQTLPMLRRRARYLLSLIRDLSPALVEEMRGLADGAGIGFADALLCQAGPETIEEAQAGGVAIAVQPPAANRPAAALWLDAPPPTASLLVLLHIQPTAARPAMLMLATAGQLGSWGMNDAGLAVLGLDLPCRPPRPALPLPPLRRAMLERRTVDECVTLARRRYVSSAAAMVMAGRAEAMAGLQIRPAAVTRIAEQAPGCIAVARCDQCNQAESSDDGVAPAATDRLERVVAALAAGYGGLDVAMLQRMVAEAGQDARGCAPHQDSGEAIGLVADPQGGRLHVCRNGCWRSYHV